MLQTLWKKLADTPRDTWILYLVLYLSVGFAAQGTHEYTRVARFAYTWQVITLYGMYLVPLSIVLRGRPWHEQFAYGVVAVAPIDAVGFAVGSSKVYPGNFIEQIFGERSFVLVFVLIAGWIPLVGNTAVDLISRWLRSRTAPETEPVMGQARARSLLRFAWPVLHAPSALRQLAPPRVGPPLPEEAVEDVMGEDRLDGRTRHGVSGRRQS